jgi:hypothetical protein
MDHPSLQLGRLRIPGPAVPIALIAFPFIVRPRILRRHLRSNPACLGYSLMAFHFLLYYHNIWEILNKKDTGDGDNNTLPFLEYVSLILGDAALQQSGLWSYICPAVSWIVPQLPRSYFSQIFFGDMRCIRAYIVLVLCLPSALRIGHRLSAGLRYVRCRYSLEPSSWSRTSSLRPCFLGSGYYFHCWL